MSKSVYTDKIEFGGPRLVIVAGPCSTESRNHAIEMMHACKEAGADAYRSGAFKPRTNPGEFDGLKEDGLRYLAEAKEIYRLPIVTEIMSIEHIPMFKEYSVDVYQVGTRNAQNFDLLHELGKLQVPVLLKRGKACAVKEWLGAAGHITHYGNQNVVLCERGIVSIDQEFRNTGDITAVAYAKRYADFPVAFDPSHATGRRDMVYQTAIASVSAGADALVIEVHDDPDFALTDGKQCILPKELGILINHARQFRERYIETQIEYNSAMEGVNSGKVTIFFRRDDLPLILETVKLDRESIRLKIYDEPTGILRARIKNGKLGELKQRHRRALGELTSFTSTSKKDVPIVSLSKPDGKTAIMTPYSGDAVRAAHKKTLDERNPGVERIELRRRYPTDIVLDAFVTFEDPLILYSVTD